MNGLAADAAQLPIEELNLPVRSFNSLRREGVHTVGGLAARTEKELLAIDGLGPQSIKEIKSRLADHGLALTTPGVTADETAGSVAAGTASAGRRGQRRGGPGPGGHHCGGPRQHRSGRGAAPRDSRGHRHRRDTSGGRQPGRTDRDLGRGRCLRGPLGRERPAAATQRPAPGRGRPRPAQRGRPAAAQAGRAGRGLPARRRGAVPHRAPPPPRVPRLTRGARCRPRRCQPSRAGPAGPAQPSASPARHQPSRRPAQPAPAQPADQPGQDQRPPCPGPGPRTWTRRIRWPGSGTGSRRSNQA